MAQTDNYPSRPITIIVPFPPGGSSDIVMRLAAQRVAEDTGHTFVIENRPGAAGNVAAMAIKNAPPDGYLLMMGHTGTHAINPTLYPDLKFDPVKDFQPITALLAFNNILVVPAASPARSVAELVALAKSKPEGLTYGSQGIGTGGHLLGVLLAKHAGIKLLHVPYRGVAPAVTDTVAGRMDLMFSSYLSAAGHIEGGQAAHAGDRRHRAPSRHSGRADAAGNRLSGRPDAAVVRPVRTRRHADADRREAQRRLRQGARRATPSRTRCCRRSRSSRRARPTSLAPWWRATWRGSVRSCANPAPRSAPNPARHRSRSSASRAASRCSGRMLRRSGAAPSAAPPHRR